MIKRRNQEKNKTRKLGTGACTSLAMGNMIGSGIFLLPSALAAYGSISLLAWIVTSLGSLFLAFVFVKLSQLFSCAPGGPYYYVMKTMDKPMGFQIAVCYFVAIIVGCSAVLVAMMGYFSVFIPGLATHHALSFLICGLLMVFITIVNFSGVQETKWLQVITLVCKITPVIFLSIVGLFYIHLANFKHFNLTHSSDFSALVSASLLTLWGFIGLESTTVPTGEIENKTRTVAISTIVSTILVGATYFLCSASIMGVLSPEALMHSSAPFADAAHVMFGHHDWIRDVIAASAVITCLNTVVGWLFLTGQLALAMTEDRFLPRWCGKVTKNNMPKRMIVFSSVAIFVIYLSDYSEFFVKQFHQLISFATLSFVVAYLYACIALLMHTWGNQSMKREVSRVMRCVTWLAFAYAVFMVAGSGEQNVFCWFFMFFGCLPLYGYLKNTQSYTSHE